MGPWGRSRAEASYRLEVLAPPSTGRPSERQTVGRQAKVKPFSLVCKCLKTCVDVLYSHQLGYFRKGLASS